MLKLQIINSGSAFDGEARGPEIARILRALADEFAEGAACGIWSLRDANGNRCGTVDLLAADCGDHPTEG